MKLQTYFRNRKILSAKRNIAYAGSQDLLGIQVWNEVRKRRLVARTVIFLFLTWYFFTYTFGDSGLLKYLEMKRKERQLATEIRDIRRVNAQLKNETDKLRKRDPFTIERHAREDFNLSRADEYVFIFDK